MRLILLASCGTDGSSSRLAAAWGPVAVGDASERSRLYHAAKRMPSSRAGVQQPAAPWSTAQCGTAEGSVRNDGFTPPPCCTRLLGPHTAAAAPSLPPLQVAKLQAEAERLISEARAAAQKQVADAKAVVSAECAKELAEAKAVRLN